MGRVDFNDVDSYQSNSGSSQFFSLANNKDKAIVKFLVDDIMDLEILAVHEINVDGKMRKVSCLRSFNEPITNCPLCAAGNKITIRYYVPMMVYSADSLGNYVGTVKLWEKGKNFKSDISTMVTSYQPLSNYPIEITRNGEKGDMHTTYTFLPVLNPSITSKIPPVDWDNIEIPTAMGSIVLDKNFDEITYFLANSKFPNMGNTSNVGQRTSVTTQIPQKGGSNVAQQTYCYSQPTSGYQRLGTNPPPGPIPGQSYGNANSSFPMGRRRTSEQGSDVDDNEVPF